MWVWLFLLTWHQEGHMSGTMKLTYLLITQQHLLLLNRGDIHEQDG